ncbi:MAG: DUF5678 domain-containing protein [Nitrososphaeraceae archaeon]|nr:DUF5678 domain-containing protein [Nitrososphaeraceae archaeon]
MSELLDLNNIEINKKFENNFHWFIEHYGQLKIDFANKIIAIDDYKVIDSDVDIELLLQRLREKYGDIRHILIKYIKNRKDI